MGEEPGPISQDQDVPRDRLPLDGLKGLVVGASTRAGRRVAVALAQAGADVAVASSSLDGDEVMACRRTRRMVEAAGRRSVEYAFDVTLGQNVQVSTRQVTKEMGGLDIVVWAVHRPLTGPSEKITDAEWARALSVNLTGAYFLCRAALREMLPAGMGAVLLVQDHRAVVEGQPQQLATVVAHAAVQGMAEALSGEFSERGVRFMSLRVLPFNAATHRPVAERGDAVGWESAELGAAAVQFASPLQGRTPSAIGVWIGDDTTP